MKTLAELAEIREKNKNKIALRHGLNNIRIVVGMEKRNAKAECKSGRKKEKMEIAKKMKNKGIDIESILSITGLSKTEINNL